MFSFVTNASKFALFHLIERLKVAKFDFIDTQFINEHLAQFGALEIPNSNFRKMLKRGIKKIGIFLKFTLKGFCLKAISFKYRNNLILITISTTKYHL